MSQLEKSEAEKQKDDKLNYINFLLVILVAFFAAYPFFWDFVNLGTRNQAVEALLYSTGFVFLITLVVIIYSHFFSK